MLKVFFKNSFVYTVDNVLTRGIAIMPHALIGPNVSIEDHTLRNETEWVELVENGLNFLVGTNIKKIIETYEITINKNNNQNQNQKLNI